MQNCELKMFEKENPFYRKVLSMKTREETQPRSIKQEYGKKWKILINFHLKRKLFLYI